MKPRSIGYPSNWGEKLEQNQDMITLYSDFISGAATFEDRIKIAEEIAKLGKQNDFIYSMVVYQFLSKKDHYSIKEASKMNELQTESKEIEYV